MTTSTPAPQTSEFPIDHSPPVGTSQAPVPLFGPEFAADQHGAYREMRQRFGSLVPVDIGVAATLITEYRDALAILTREERYPTDPTAWAQQVPPECPALPSLGPRPDALHTSGGTHSLYRLAISETLSLVDQFALENTVKRVAVLLINRFCERDSADLLGEFARPLVVDVVHGVLGLSPEAGQHALNAILTLRATDPASVKQGNRMLEEAMSDTVVDKRAAPGMDVTSWLLQHRSGLSVDEVIHQLAMLYRFTEPTWNLIANAVLLAVTDEPFGEDALGGALSPQEAIEEVLYSDPPLAIAFARFPRQMQILDGGGTVHEHEPVLVGLAACNSDPAAVGEDRTGNRGNRAHLSFGAGAQKCPAESMATLIAREALAQLWDALPDIELAVPVDRVERVANPFLSALVALPVRFRPSPQLPLP
ncbi:cytochrome P450 [Nocardia sp. NPDC051990]|uniref:cytochrome P450 n=1 Tax=Nocardia sp. NPDC051990 TaxID=3155285 RepID=UPI0034343600